MCVTLASQCQQLIKIHCKEKAQNKLVIMSNICLSIMAVRFICLKHHMTDKIHKYCKT